MLAFFLKLSYNVLTVLDGELVVPCTWNLLYAGSNSNLRAFATFMFAKQVCWNQGLMQQNFCEPCEDLTVATLNLKFVCHKEALVEYFALYAYLLAMFEFCPHSFFYTLKSSSTNLFIDFNRHFYPPPTKPHCFCG